MAMKIQTFFVILFTFLSFEAKALEFDEEIVVFTSESAIEFARNTRGSIGVDSKGHTHIVYGIPDESSNPPRNQIFYQVIEDHKASFPVRVDSGSLGGGRHPSLVIDANDLLHVVWQDYRHTTSAGNYIDNVEIYYDQKSVNGSFSSSDIRLTTTNAGHQGDNGYVPQIVVGPDNRLCVTWYDFTRNGNNADIYLISSDENGVFPDQEGIESFRITSVEQNPDNYTSNWLPDLAALPDGLISVIWGFLRGWQGAFQLQGLTASANGILSPVESIADKGGRFNDPARLISDSEGNLMVVYPEYVDGMYRINLHYKPLGEEWRGPLVVNDGTLSASQPCAAYLSPSEVIVVWQEDLGGIHQIAMAHVNPQMMEIGHRAVLSQMNQDARTPSISSHPMNGKTAVAWIEHGWDGMYAIKVRSTDETDIDHWLLY